LLENSGSYSHYPDECADGTGGELAEADDRTARGMRGRVKWFDPQRGFGFIVPDDGGPEVLLHATVLRNDGYSWPSEGARIEVEVHHSGRGIQARRIVALEEPAEQESVVPAHGAEAGSDIEALPIEPARVKWFDRVRGFGFANVFGRAEDVFVHAEVLRLAGRGELIAGEAVAVRVGSGRRGPVAVQVLHWEVGCGARG
jgi:CspA family cold shock protein